MPETTALSILSAPRGTMAQLQSGCRSCNRVPFDWLSHSTKGSFVESRFGEQMFETISNSCRLYHESTSSGRPPSARSLPVDQRVTLGRKEVVHCPQTDRARSRSRLGLAGSINLIVSRT